MKISELATLSGVSAPTIKYYIREGLLPEGERTSPTQADYGDKHVQRLRVIRALIGSGVSIAESKRMIETLDDPPAEPFMLLGAAHAAITPPIDENLDLSAAQSLVAGLGWQPEKCDEAVLYAVARALKGIESAGFAVPEEVMPVYLESIRRIADAEIANVPADSLESAVRYVVLGSVLVEPLLLALRRVAQQLSSAERFGATGT